MSDNMETGGENYAHAGWDAMTDKAAAVGVTRILFIVQAQWRCWIKWNNQRSNN